MSTRFPKADVTVTLTGEEWTTILGALTWVDATTRDAALSPKGRAVYHRAGNKLGEQVLAAQKRINS